MTQREREIIRLIEENPMISQQEIAEKTAITRSSVAVHISNLMKKGYIAGKGYVLRTASYIVVIGAVNMDIGGRGYENALVQADSNPGRVSMSLGGVGRNIAHNLALLQTDVRFLTAFGDDMYAQRIAASCGDLGIDISHALTLPGGRTSTYLFIADGTGDMKLAVSDMEIYEQMTPEFFQNHRMLINNAQLVVVDANIPERSLAWLSENVTVPLFADPVSTAKAERLKPIIGKLHTIKPNRLEAELLSGMKIIDAESLRSAAQSLLGTGLHRVFISLGAEGIYAADGTNALHLEAYVENMVNTTGCGDAFMAAIAWAYLEGKNLEETTKIGLAAASIAMESGETINGRMSGELIGQRIRKITTIQQRSTSYETVS